MEPLTILVMVATAIIALYILFLSFWMLVILYVPISLIVGAIFLWEYVIAWLKIILGAWIAFSVYIAEKIMLLFN